MRYEFVVDAFLECSSDQNLSDQEMQLITRSAPRRLFLFRFSLIARAQHSKFTCLKQGRFFKTNNFQPSIGYRSVALDRALSAQNRSLSVTKKLQGVNPRRFWEFESPGSSLSRDSPPLPQKCSRSFSDRAKVASVSTRPSRGNNLYYSWENISE